MTSSGTERLFDPRVVDTFFYKMVPEETGFTALREAVIPLPESGPDGYRRVLFLGTTGAGKTTLVRQLMGTDPVKERFPSTSTAKTTIHDTEIVLDGGNWRAAVTSPRAMRYVSTWASVSLRRSLPQLRVLTMLRCFGAC